MDHMNQMSNPIVAVDPADLLSIGDLSERTGVAPATLRMWEQRHGFPVPQRLPSGHRRYAEGDVATVMRVLDKQAAGVRLGAAIGDALSAPSPDRPLRPSVWAELRRRHPGLPVHRLTKATLLALSWAIEDEFAAKADHAHLFGLFQRQEFYRPARARWRELARISGSAFAFLEDPDPVTEGEPGPVPVHLGPDSPMLREWAVVCDSVELPVVLTAWEVPGQENVRDRDRVFEALWTLDPQAVRDAARVCAAVAADAGRPEAGPVQYALADDPAPGLVDLATASTLFGRVLTYVDDVARRR